MNKNFVRLAAICDENKIKDLQILDKDNRLTYGEACVPHVIGYDKKTQRWYARIVDTSRGVICENIYCKDEREACVAFIEMSERWLHLSRHLNEFEVA